ncbi:MAG TPA: penicillin acylase family protein [Terriglobia bacterium]|nr:penicillin acylase family protein [Terriglobia bacterium]
MNKPNRFGAWRPTSRASVAFLAVVVTLSGLAAGVLAAQHQHVTDRATPPPRSTLRIKGLKARAEVYRDTYGIPHIDAASAEDAYFALGYIHATDRPLEMEFFRRRASGTLAEVFGRPLLDDDIFIRQIGIRRGAEAIWRSPRLDEYQGGRVRREVEAYCAGVNARFQEVGTAKLAEKFRPLGIVPAPWTPVDALAFPRYMGWDQSGTDTDVWMGMLVEKLGLAAVDELFPLDRPYEISTVPSDRSVRPHLSAEDAPRLPADFDTAALELHRHFVSGRFGSEFALGSNNWAVDGTKSSTGKPLLANDPHLGFQLPSIWYTAHLVAPGLNITGVTFAGFPYTIIGHNDRIAWGLTNMQADAVDYFIEKTDPARPHQYLYQGAWRATSRREEDVPVRGEPSVHLEIESTVHGPLVTTHGASLALEWTGLEPSFEVIAFSRLNTARNLADYKAALRDLKVPALNVIYADVDGNIAIAPHGALPIRKRGLGRWPVDGSSGDYDWAGMIPDDQLPFSLNPPQHYLASANGRPAPVGYPYYLGWMWDPSYRTRRIHQLLSAHDHIALEQMEAFQMDTHDSAAESFVPVLIGAYDRKRFGDAAVRRAIDELRRWDFNAIPDSVAPTVWSAWFELYRAAVWQDHFDAAGVEPWPGGWGYAGSNERQPELEVLEFLTHANPASTWFDDVRTPEKETRDDVMARSFVQTVAQLVKERGESIDGWRWGKTNVLRLHSITQQSALDRGAEPVGGDEFTLSPGDNGHEVTGGASWRMVVDLGHLERSVGMYPGGQSEDPGNPHYNDQTKAWTAGRYLPLYFYAKPQQFKPGEVESELILQPN